MSRTIKRERVYHMNRKAYIVVALFVVFVASMFMYTGCGKSDDTGPNTFPDPSNTVGEQATQDGVGDGRKNSEEELSDLKVDLVEGQDYMTIDRELEDFELVDLEGNKVVLSDYKDKIVFLNFWATWCPPCKAEMPHMQEIHDEYEDVVILAVNSTSLELRGGSDSKKAKEKVAKFIKDEGYTFTVLLDSDDKVMDIYNSIYPMIGIPTTFIIDKGGTIRYVRPGIFIDKEYMEKFIKLAQQ